MASVAGSTAYTLARFPPGCGLVSFNYGTARGIGFVARQEPDPDHPDNLAHANVYNNAPTGNARKKMAARLVDAIVAAGGVLVPPTFASA